MSDIVAQHKTTFAKLCELVNHDKQLHDKVKLTSPSGISVYADSSPAPVSDPDERQGWLFEKIAADSSKFNYYMYSQGSHAFTLADLKSVFMTGAIDHWTNTSSCPFVVVYTKMTGSGDAGSWYKSRVAYSLSSSEKIVPGELVNLYAKNNPHLKNSLRDIPLTQETLTGTGADTEEILTISIQSDSASAISTKILVSNMGYKLNAEVHRNISLV